MAETVVTTSLSLLVGALITWFVSRQYYRKASEDLREEAGRLRNYSVLILRALEEFGTSSRSALRLNRDPKSGEPVGIHFIRTVNDPLSTTDNAQPEISTEDQEGGEQN